MTKTQSFSPRYLSGAKIFGHLSHSTELVRMCLVVNTLTSAAPIVITGDVRGGGTRDEPQRTSAWKVEGLGTRFVKVSARQRRDNTNTLNVNSMAQFQHPVQQQPGIPAVI